MVNPATAHGSPPVPFPRLAAATQANRAAPLDIDLSAPAASTTLLVVTGELDHVTAPALHIACEAAVRHRRQHLIVDLSQVTFMSSAGINLMVNLRREYAPPHELHVVLNATATRLWDLIGITDLFTIHPSRTAALAAITRI